MVGALIQVAGDGFFGLPEWLMIFLFLSVMVAVCETGYRLGRRSRAEEKTKAMVPIVAGSILAIMGLLLGFTMSMSVSRYDGRRLLVLDEANAMRGDAQLTGWLLGMRISTNPYSSAKDDLQAVAEAFPGFRTLRTIVHQRAAFEKAEKLGLAVTELEKPNTSERRARDSIRELHREVFGVTDTTRAANA